MQSTPTTHRLAVLAVAIVFITLIASLALTQPSRGTEGMVGAVGCSQTNDIFNGLGMIGADGFWSRDSTSNYGGGALYEWADPDASYWNEFSEALRAYPDTTDIWIELCLRQPSEPSATAADLAAGEAVVAHVRDLAPNVTVYVSPYNAFEGVECWLAGPYGLDVAEDIAEHLVATGQALAGPTVGPLDPSLLKDDGCHANDEGGILQAEQLVAFFYGDGSTPIPSGSDAFLDIAGSVFKADIEWLADRQITTGCNPPENNLFCPYDDVTRGQMAAFLHRAMPQLPEVRPGIDFADDDGSSFESDIEWLYSRGIAEGTSATTYSPYAPITRAQMAAFLTRALGYSDDGGGDLFIDDDGSPFETEIDMLGTAGVTTGCNPPADDMFCPGDPVKRGQMAAFLHRALGD